jgi:hypothetical protein
MIGAEIAPPATASHAVSSKSRRVTFLMKSLFDFFTLTSFQTSKNQIRTLSFPTTSPNNSGHPSCVKCSSNPGLIVKNMNRIVYFKIFYVKLGLRGRRDKSNRRSHFGSN